MISIMIKSAIVLALAACIASLLRRQSAALRHAVWTAGLIGALVIPLFSVTLPSWQNAIVGKAESLFQFRTAEQSVNPPIDTPANVAANGNAPSAAATISADAAQNGAGDAAPHRRSLFEIAAMVWLAGAAIGILFMLLGALRLAWVAIRSEPVTDPRWIALAEDVRRSLGLRRPVRLLQSKSGHFLGTWGILVPRVLLPSNAGEWSDDRAWMVLGHELAHIKRHDWFVQVLAEAARAIYWFNPVFWIAYGRLRRESEHACDDTVVRMGAAGTRYAEELLDLARMLRTDGQAHSPILAMAQPSHLERRLVALLNPALNRLAATPWSIIVVAGVAIALTLPLAAVRAPEKTAKALYDVPSVIAPAATVEAAPQPPLNVVKTESPKVESRDLSLPKTEIPDSVNRPIEIQPDASLPSASTKTAPVLIAKINAPPVLAPKPAPAFECKITPATQETKMKETKAALGSGPWHINEDRTIWTWDQPFVAGAQVNTMWMRPANVDLVITGRRLDGDAAPLQARLAKDSSATYIATSLTFPKAGCWEVTATAGPSTLTFITRVESQ